jgi:hypothetical protein
VEFVSNFLQYAAGELNCQSLCRFLPLIPGEGRAIISDLDSRGQPVETANETADNANAESDLLKGAVERAGWLKKYVRIAFRIMSL